MVELENPIKGFPPLFGQLLHSEDEGGCGEDEEVNMNLDLLEDEDNDEDAILPHAQLSQLGISISDGAQPSQVPCEVDLHEVCKRIAARLAINWPALQDDRGEERDLYDMPAVPACMKEMKRYWDKPFHHRMPVKGYSGLEIACKPSSGGAVFSPPSQLPLHVSGHGTGVPRQNGMLHSLHGTPSPPVWEICVVTDLILRISRDAVQGLVVVGEKSLWLNLSSLPDQEKQTVMDSPFNQSQAKWLFEEAVTAMQQASDLRKKKAYMGSFSSKWNKPSREKQTIFKSKNEEVFRIPALYYNKNKKKKLFAFAEKRTSKTDSDAVALVMKTGTVDEKKTVKWSKSEELMRKCSCGYRPMNPCAVYENQTQTLFLFFIYVIETESWQLQNHQNWARLCYITKKKDDDKWSKFTEVTDQLHEIQNWSTFAVGPGHGIQTNSGRMIVPAYAYDKKKKSLVPHSFYFYSDDKGETWKCETQLEETSLECELAEVSVCKGHSLVYCNARSMGSCRVQAEIDRSGLQTFKTDIPLVEIHRGCQGSVISFPAQPGAGKTSQETKWLLFSHPIDPKGKRLDLGIYLSTSPIKSDRKCSGEYSGECSEEWCKPWVINQGPSGYSDLAYIDDGWFACLMECGEVSESEQIACLLFSYDEILKGING
ncbi:LOW QUALITY PROTEIN: sialidase-3-like [Anableps anableps]